jgi:cyclase
VLGSRFDFSGIIPTLPLETFTGKLVILVGSKEVDLVEFGPAHTRGDIVAYVPSDRIVFTGDIVFNGGHPVIWAGPIHNWIDACDTILRWNVETVVPGHGAITDKSGVRSLKHYLEFVRDESRRRWEAGMGYEEAARDISLRSFADWTDSERIVANVHACYREFNSDASPPPIPALFGAMARYRAIRSSIACQ